MRGGLALGALAWLAACAAPQADIRSTITPEAIAASTEPLLFVELPETGAQAIMSLTGRNGDVVTWSTADGRSISLQDGVLVATRGFGFDLMSADVSGTLAALAGGPREYERFASFLDGENATIVRSYQCEMVGPYRSQYNNFGRQLIVNQATETCIGLYDQRIVEYWFDGSGVWTTVNKPGTQNRILMIERISRDSNTNTIQ